MRKLIATILLLSQMLIVAGNVLPVMINFYYQKKAEISLNSKLNQLPARTSLLSALSDIARQHEKNKQSKPLPESLVTSSVVFACVDEGSSLIKIFCTAKIVFSDFETLDTLEGFVGLLFPPPKSV